MGYLPLGGTTSASSLRWEKLGSPPQEHLPKHLGESQGETGEQTGASGARVRTQLYKGHRQGVVDQGKDSIFAIMSIFSSLVTSCFSRKLNIHSKFGCC